MEVNRIDGVLIAMREHINKVNIAGERIHKVTESMKEDIERLSRLYDVVTRKCNTENIGSIKKEGRYRLVDKT